MEKGVNVKATVSIALAWAFIALFPPSGCRKGDEGGPHAPSKDRAAEPGSLPPLPAVEKGWEEETGVPSPFVPAPGGGESSGDTVKGPSPAASSECDAKLKEREEILKEIEKIRITRLLPLSGRVSQSYGTFMECTRSPDCSDYLLRRRTIYESLKEEEKRLEDEIVSLEIELYEINKRYDLLCREER